MRTIKQKALAAIAAMAKTAECEAVLNDMALRGETEILVQQGWTAIVKVTFTFGADGTQVYITSPAVDTLHRPDGWLRTAHEDKVRRGIRWYIGSEVDGVFDYIRSVIDAAAAASHTRKGS